jgi:phospholipase C
MRKPLFCTSLGTSIAILSVLATHSGLAQAGDAQAHTDDATLVTVGVPSSPEAQTYVGDGALKPALSHDRKLSLLREKLKYVFVLFQENRSFDFHFGTFPGADGSFSHPPAATAGFIQPIVNTDGSLGTISPFLIPQSVVDINGKTVPLYPADTDSVDHTHAGINNSLDIDAHGVARNDRYALNEEGLTTLKGLIVARGTLQPAPSSPTLQQKQRAQLVMAHIDCDTIPFLWQYADRFTLFDNFHETIIGPSTPNAIAMIAGQSGQTQWVLQAPQGGESRQDRVASGARGEPVVGDPGPFPGSNLDTAPTKPPYNAAGEKPNAPAPNQTYASLPLSFMGNKIEDIIKSDENPAMDLLDVQTDIKKIVGDQLDPVAWGWYQEGYDHEPTDGGGAATHNSYIVHHNGPQYFGYIGDNPAVASNLHGLADFFADIAAKRLPDRGGVFYVRGGYNNNDGLLPLDPNPAVHGNFVGSDDHPGYSDAQIAEALLADAINAIASSPYWPNSVIIITYDESDGLYDHADPHIRSFDPKGAPLAGGPRIPAIVISPFGRAHMISHEYAEHSSVIKFIDELHGLTPLADLPDEANARRLGQSLLGQGDLGPADDKVAEIGDLLSAFDNGRLLGRDPPLPPEYAEIPRERVLSLPHDGGRGCARLHIVPTDYVDGKLIDPPPPDFNPRPGTTPGIPTSGTWTP